MADGTITIDSKLETKKLEVDLKLQEKELAGVNKQLATQEAKMASLEAKAKSMTAAFLETARAMGQDPTDAEIAAAIPGFQQVNMEMLSLQGNIDKTRIKQQALNDKITETKARIAGASKFSGMRKGAEGVAKAFKKINQRLAGIMSRVMVFSLIMRALRAVVEWFGKIAKTSPELTSAIAKLKGALQTMAQPLVEVIIPALTALVTLLARVASAAARFVSALFGKTAAQSADAASALHNQTEALNGVGGAAKKAGKQMAAFDEINQISDTESSGGGGGGSSTIQPDFSGVEGGISGLEVYMAGALLALGAILTFTGASVPLGLGLMAAGAVGLASALSTDWETMPRELKGAISKTLIVLGAAALVIGAILTFGVPGKTALGIGLMVAGAAALGTAVALNWDTIKTALQGPIGKVTAIVSGALLAIGAVLAFTGVALPLGIGLMAAGAVGLATVTALNWDTIKEKLQGPLGKIVAIVSAALLAVGIILACTGVALPLGIALIAAGAAGLATVTALNWDTIKEKVQNIFKSVGDWVKTWGLLVLGIILTLSGNPFLGIPLMLKGGANLTAAQNPAWMAIVEKVKEIWGKIKDFWNIHIAPWFTKAKWVELVGKIGEGLKNGFKSAINGVISIVEKGVNWIIEKLNTLSWVIPDWVPMLGGKTFGFNFSPISIPRLAEGAVLPGGREFLAVLGDQPRGQTNIEAPLETIKQALAEVLAGGFVGGGEQTVILQLDRQTLGKVVYKLNRDETRRIGVRLAEV